MMVSMYTYASLYRSVIDGRRVVNPLGLAKRIKTMAPEFAAAGGTGILYPPLTMSQSGNADTGDGYGKVADFNVGQFPNRPTRWGTAQEVLESIETVHECGMEALEDAVIHQYAGNLPIYELGPDGKVDKNMFPKLPMMFYPNVPVDDVFNPEGNEPFGQMTSFQNGNPAGYMLHNTIWAMLWRKGVFGLDGGRLDAAKGEASSVCRRMAERVGGRWFGEVFVGNPYELMRWVRETGGLDVLDFTFHWALKAACEGGSLKGLVRNGFWALSSGDAVTFVDSADTDTNPTQAVRFNKLHAYFMQSVTPAHDKHVYGGDWEKYNLKKDIANYMWIDTKICRGPLGYNYVDDNLIVINRNGDGGTYGRTAGLLGGFSADPINVREQRVLAYPFTSGDVLHDFTGHHDDVRVDWDGSVLLRAKPNVNGTARNAFAFSKYGPEGSCRLAPRAHRATGKFFEFPTDKLDKVVAA